MKNLEAKITMAKNPEIVEGLKDWFSYDKDKGKICPRWRDRYDAYGRKRFFTCDDLCNELWDGLKIKAEQTYQQCPCLSGKTDVAEQFQEILDLAKCIEVCGTPKPVQAETKERTYRIGDVFQWTGPHSGLIILVQMPNNNFCLTYLEKVNNAGFTSASVKDLSIAKLADLVDGESNVKHTKYLGNISELIIEKGKVRAVKEEKHSNGYQFIKTIVRSNGDIYYLEEI